MISASIGILKFPDLFTRIQATTKASSFAMGCFLIAVIFYFKSLDVSVRASVIILFIFLTTPLSAHMIARSAHRRKVSLWKKTLVDELRENSVEKKEKTDLPKNKPKEPQSKIADIIRKIKGGK